MGNKVFAAIIFAAAIFLCYSLPAHAINFIVSPPRFEFTMSPGSSTTEAVQVTNFDDSPLELRLYTSDWEMDINGNQTYKNPGTLKTSCSNWVRVNPLRLTLEPKETKLARFTITAPPSEIAGSYWTMIFFESRPVTPTKAPMGVSIAGRVGVFVYATIAGNEQRAGRILDMKVNKDKENIYKLAVIFENTGNIYSRPKGTWLIKNDAGKRVKKGEIGEFLVLPHKQRINELRLEEGEAEKPVPIQLPPGKYALSVELDYGAKDLVGGDLVFEVPAAAPPAPATGK